MKNLLNRYPALNVCAAEIEAARDRLIQSFSADGKLLLCGNGGSCADCDHIVGELMKGFLSLRPLEETQKNTMKQNCSSLTDEKLCRLQRALPAISLPSMSALSTAFCNDVSAEMVFAQGVLGLGRPQDILLAISTSGNSKNVLRAAEVAKGLGICVISLTGGDGGALRALSDVCICVSERETYKVQELHLPIYHYLCAAIEAHFFRDSSV